MQARDWHRYPTTNHLPHVFLRSVPDWFTYHIDYHRDQLSIMRMCTQYIDDKTMPSVYLRGCMPYGIERDHNNHWDCLSYMRLCSISDDDNYESMPNLHLRSVLDRVPCNSDNHRDELPKLHLCSNDDN